MSVTVNRTRNTLGPSTWDRRTNLVIQPLLVGHGLERPLVDEKRGTSPVCAAFHRPRSSKKTLSMGVGCRVPFFCWHQYWFCLLALDNREVSPRMPVTPHISPNDPFFSRSFVIFVRVGGLWHI